MASRSGGCRRTASTNHARRRGCARRPLTPRGSRPTLFRGLAGRTQDDFAEHLADGLAISAAAFAGVAEGQAARGTAVAGVASIRVAGDGRQLGEKVRVFEKQRAGHLDTSAAAAPRT